MRHVTITGDHAKDIAAYRQKAEALNRHPADLVEDDIETAEAEIEAGGSLAIFDAIDCMYNYQQRVRD